MQKRILFASDLDNTLLFSHRHAAPGDVCVEWLDGEKQGFFSPRTIELLRIVAAHATFVPVTTRSVAQYERIRWPQGCQPRLAVTTNGAVLLTRPTDGNASGGGAASADRSGSFVRDTAWDGALRPVLAAAHDELLALCAAHADDARYRICRMVDDAYLFLRPADDDRCAALAAEVATETALPIAASGRKLYVLPRGLDKGSALARLRARTGATLVLAAGDSAMDAPLLAAAGRAFTLPGLAQPGAETFREPDARAARFAEWTLERVLDAIARA